MKSYIVTLTAIVSCGAWAENDFVPINFEGYGFDRPSISFVMGGDSTLKVAKGSAAVAVVRYEERKEGVAGGLSMNIQGKSPVEVKMLDEKKAKKAIEELMSPFNYGDGRTVYANLKPQPRFDLALELTNGDLFVRFYFDESITYCNFYCQDGSASPVWTLSPRLKKIVAEAMAAITEK